MNEIERLNKMRQDFVANVSHELRTPLTVIHGYVELLLQHYQEEPTLSDIFSNMRQQTLRMEALIEDLLLLSKIENESPHAEEEKVDLHDLLQSLQSDMRHLGKEHCLIWQLDDRLELLGNAHELRSAFSNLMTNAIRYTKPGGTITIQTGINAKEQAYLMVEDTGVGIASDHLPRLTERFYRVDKGRSRKSGGTGLGLAIVKHVLLRHQAELQIDSVLNQGSRFSCIFPAERTRYMTH